MFEFNRAWSKVSYRRLISAQVALLFGLASVLVCAVTLLLLRLDFNQSYGPIAQFFYALLGVTGGLSCFFLISGMHQFRNARELRDPIGGKKSKLGSIALLFGIWYAAIIYYLLVYLPARQISLKREGSGRYVS
jgi:drug/metabolite transporter (DMT)-like permease